MFRQESPKAILTLSEGCRHPGGGGMGGVNEMAGDGWRSRLAWPPVVETLIRKESRGERGVLQHYSPGGCEKLRA